MLAKREAMDLFAGRAVLRLREIGLWASSEIMGEDAVVITLPRPSNRKRLTYARHRIAFGASEYAAEYIDAQLEAKLEDLIRREREAMTEKSRWVDPEPHEEATVNERSAN